MIGSRTWEESILKILDVGIVFLWFIINGNSPLTLDLTPNEDELYKCLPMYKKILSTIEVVQ